MIDTQGLTFKTVSWDYFAQNAKLQIEFLKLLYSHGIYAMAQIVKVKGVTNRIPGGQPIETLADAIEMLRGPADNQGLYYKLARGESLTPEEAQTASECQTIVRKFLAGEFQDAIILKIRNTKFRDSYEQFMTRFFTAVRTNLSNRFVFLTCLRAPIPATRTTSDMPSPSSAQPQLTLEVRTRLINLLKIEKQKLTLLYAAFTPVFFQPGKVGVNKQPLAEPRYVPVLTALARLANRNGQLDCAIQALEANDLRNYITILENSQRNIGIVNKFLKETDMWGDLILVQCQKKYREDLARVGISVKSVTDLAVKTPDVQLV